MKIFINMMNEGIFPSPERFENIRDAANAIIIDDAVSLRINKDYLYTVVIEIEDGLVKSNFTNDCALLEAEDIIKEYEREYANG